LSPRRIEFDEGEFVRDAAESRLSVRAIEDNHLVALEQSDMMWLHAPDGYVGTSGAFEIGYALAKGIPIFSNQTVNDVALREYIHCVPSVYAAKRLISDQV
jgi:nucleoside 2-deoxyribosyltransferase